MPRPSSAHSSFQTGDLVALYVSEDDSGKRVAEVRRTGRVTNMNEANDYLKRQYRPNWTLNG